MSSPSITQTKSNILRLCVPLSRDVTSTRATIRESNKADNIFSLKANKNAMNSETTHKLYFIYKSKNTMPARKNGTHKNNPKEVPWIMKGRSGAVTSRPVLPACGVTNVVRSHVIYAPTLVWMLLFLLAGWLLFLFSHFWEVS